MKTSQLFLKNINNINLFFIILLVLFTILVTFFIPQDSLALTKPTLQSPGNNAEITSTSCTFSWSHPYNDKYELKIKTQGGTLKYASGKTSSKSITVDLSGKLTIGSTYKWYVVVYANGKEDSSEDRWFTYKPNGYCSISGGVNVPSEVVLGQYFSINFTLKEVRGAPKTFENVAIAIRRSDNAYVFDFAMYSNVTVAANGTWSQTATNYLYATNPPGIYKVVICGKVGGEWFEFDTVDSGHNHVTFQAKKPEGYCSVSEGVNVPKEVVLGQNFTISFTLKEVRGAAKTFEYVAIGIRRADTNAWVFDFELYSNVTVPPNGTWSQTKTNYLYATHPPGTYKVVICGMVGGQWFEFDTVGSGRNKVMFEAKKQEGYCSISEGVNVPKEVILGQNFTISFALKEVRGAPKTFEYVAIGIRRADTNAWVFDFELYSNVTIQANGTWSQSKTNYIYEKHPSGTYKVVICGKLVGGEWFEFDTVGSARNHLTFDAKKPDGYCSISAGVSISPDHVVLGQNFSISFTLKEVRGFPKTFENVAVAIISPDGSSFDFATFGSVTVSANGTWSQTATNFIYDMRLEGTYTAVVRGKVGGEWFDFDKTDSGVNPKQFIVKPSGHCSVSGGVSISAAPVILGQNFNISFTLKEVRGAPKTFESVTIAILRSDNSYVFDFAIYNNVKIGANGAWSRTTANRLFDTNPPDTYKAIIRGKVVGGEWFDFNTTGSGVNPKQFMAVKPESYPYSRYHFKYYYNDGSNDSYSGYVINRNGLVSAGVILKGTTYPLGNATTRGNSYYKLYYIENLNVGEEDIGKCYVTRFDDGNTEKASFALYPNLFGKTARSQLYVGNQGLGLEYGYVYDPSVPYNDSYFGNLDVAYYFSSSEPSKVNFLATYIKYLPYWDQPKSLKKSTEGVCTAVAGSILLSYWYKKDYPNIFAGYNLNVSKRQIWANDTTNKNYNKLISDLYYNYLCEGLNIAWGGLEEYITSKDYDFDRDGDIFSWSINWDELKNTLDKGEPAIVLMSNDTNISALIRCWVCDESNKTMGHATVARGYWNDKRILCNFGWGNGKVKTIYGQPLTNVSIKLDTKTDISYIRPNGETITFPDVKIDGIIRFWPK